MLITLAEETAPVVKFIVGKVIPYFDIEPLTQEQLNRELSEEMKAKKEPTFNDSSHVIKVSEAIKCCEKKFTNATLIAEFLKVAVKNLIAGKTLKKPSQDLLDGMAACIRENCLRSDTPRVFSRTFRYHRPSKGHGVGRVGF